MWISALLLTTFYYCRTAPIEAVGGCQNTSSVDLSTQVFQGHLLSSTARFRAISFGYTLDEDISEEILEYSYTDIIIYLTISDYIQITYYFGLRMEELERIEVL